ncbi:MAG: flippase-like domain-containing protein [Methylacidiphilales bacterium]|nr:flippase-like domain-containing protein [Candidatus Methylacidiphilales bacterium]
MEFLRRRLGLIFRLVISVLAISYVIHTYDWGKVWENARTMNVLWLLVGLICFIPTLLIVSWRWRMLLGVHDVHMRFWRVFELTMIGQFFSTVGIGATGGDVFKIFYVTRAVPDRRTAVAFTVILDRVVGMLALLLFGVLLSFTRLPLLFSQSNTRIATGTFYIIAVAGLVAAILASLGPYFLDSPIFAKMGQKLPMAQRGKKLYAAYDRSARALGVNVTALFASIPSHMAITLFGYCVLRAMQLPSEPDFISFCSTVAIVNLLSALPVTISGVGYPILFPMFFHLLGISHDKAGAFALTYFAMNVLWCLAGGPFYFLYRHETHTPPPDTAEVGPIFSEP